MTAPPAGALEACPFCRGEAVAENYVIEAQVVCRGCGAKIARSHGARDDNGLPEAIAAWNRRADATALRLREGWRPIESAPVDGTEFQAWIGDWEPRCRFNEDGVFQIWGRVDYDMDGWDSYPDAPPTHWMPLPAPPTADDLARVLEEGE